MEARLARTSGDDPGWAGQGGDAADGVAQPAIAPTLAASLRGRGRAGGATVTAKRKKRPGRSGGPRGTSWRQLCADGLKLPGVEERTSYRTPALFFRKKLLARLREDGETVAVAVELLDRDVLLQADPAAFFLTDHYRGYPWVLMRLAMVRHRTAIELLEQAWRRAAPTGLAERRLRSAPAARGAEVRGSTVDPEVRRGGASGTRRRRPGGV